MNAIELKNQLLLQLQECERQIEKEQETLNLKAQLKEIQRVKEAYFERDEHIHTYYLLQMEGSILEQISKAQQAKFPWKIYKE